MRVRCHLTSARNQVNTLGNWMQGVTILKGEVSYSNVMEKDWLKAVGKMVLLFKGVCSVTYHTLFTLVISRMMRNMAKAPKLGYEMVRSMKEHGYRVRDMAMVPSLSQTVRGTKVSGFLAEDKACRL